MANFNSSLIIQNNIHHSSFIIEFMIFLVEFSPIKPDFGLFFWTLTIFLAFFFLMRKFALKPIVAALKEREEGITTALASADNARKEMSNLKAENETILAQAREERMKMLKEAKDQATAIIAESKNNAKAETSKILATAQQDIENMKAKALTDVKNQTGQLAIAIAEKILKKELAGNPEQQAFVNSVVNDMKLG